MRPLFFFLFLFPLALPVRAQSTEPATDPLVFDEAAFEAAFRAYADSVHATLTWQTGTIVLGDGVATLVVPEGYRYLDAEQSHYVLEELWDNPPAETWGMLFPADLGPLDEAGWAIDITYEADGYVSDEDAHEIDYDDLLADMQKGTREDNAVRIEQGYEPIELVGWAAPPRYDAAAKKLHWAKELSFGEAQEHVLNYNIRVLGRKGVLMLNAIGSMAQLGAIETAVPPVLASVDFNEGYRYAEFDPDFDQVAAYGIGGLIAGKLLTKVGFFALLLKGWKFIALGFVALGGFLKKRLFGRKDDEDAPAAGAA